MLGLKLPTDPRWVNIAEKNIEEILTDHAYCEQKAASQAISLIIGYPEKSDLVDKMTALAREEMGHFQMVHNRIVQRGFVLGRERRDEYVNELHTYFPKGGDREERLAQKLLLCALIEARSCERFKVLSENIEDEELSSFYHTLMISEANHYTMFITLARKYFDREKVDEMWEGLLTFEAEVISKLGNTERIHG